MAAATGFVAENFVEWQKHCRSMSMTQSPTNGRSRSGGRSSHRRAASRGRLLGAHGGIAANMPPAQEVMFRYSGDGLQSEDEMLDLDSRSDSFHEAFVSRVLEDAVDVFSTDKIPEMDCLISDATVSICGDDIELSDDGEASAVSVEHDLPESVTPLVQELQPDVTGFKFDICAVNFVSMLLDDAVDECSDDRIQDVEYMAEEDELLKDDSLASRFEPLAEKSLHFSTAAPSQESQIMDCDEDDDTWVEATSLFVDVLFSAMSTVAASPTSSMHVNVCNTVDGAMEDARSEDDDAEVMEHVRKITCFEEVYPLSDDGIEDDCEWFEEVISLDGDNLCEERHHELHAARHVAEAVKLAREATEARFAEEDARQAKEAACREDAARLRAIIQEELELKAAEDRNAAAARKKQEEEMARRLEDAARLRAILQEEARLKAAEDQLMREKKAAEDEACRVQAAKQAAENEAATVQAAKQAAEEEAVRVQAAKQAAEEEAARVQAAKHAAEEAARVQAAKQAAEEAARVQAAKKAAEDEAARVKAAKQAAEEEAGRIKAAKHAAEEAARVQAAKQAAEEEAARVQAAKRAAEEEAARVKAAKQAAEEAAKLQAAAAKKAAEEEVQRKIEAAKAKAAEEEAARVIAEKAAARKAAEEEAARIKARKAAENEAARIRAAKAKAAEEEAARLRAKKAAEKKAAEEEAARVVAEEEARARAEEARLVEEAEALLNMGDEATKAKAAQSEDEVSRLIAEEEARLFADEGMQDGAADGGKMQSSTSLPADQWARTRRRIIGRVVREPAVGQSEMQDAFAVEARLRGHRRALQTTSNRRNQGNAPVQSFSMDMEEESSEARESSLARGYDALGVQFFSMQDHDESPGSLARSQTTQVPSFATMGEGHQSRNTPVSAMQMDLGVHASSGSRFGPTSPQRLATPSRHRMATQQQHQQHQQQQHQQLGGTPSQQQRVSTPPQQKRLSTPSRPMSTGGGMMKSSSAPRLQMAPSMAYSNKSSVASSPYSSKQAMSGTGNFPAAMKRTVQMARTASRHQLQGPVF